MDQKHGNGTQKGKKIPLEAYRLSDPVDRARFFLGKRLVVETTEGRVSGLICETEAYGGAEDRACHGFGNRKTRRNWVLFEEGGIAYVYLCYGMHYLLNFVLGPKGIPLAVLIRAVWIIEGRSLVQLRRKGVDPKNWANGPGRVTQALGIDGSFNGLSLVGDRIWVEETGLVVPEKELEIGSRVGVDYAGDWAKMPWRFRWIGAQNHCLF
ncbi:DNA-3-methyladenine glycosylase [Candidatus Methylacidithermus pantelleriae]|uniref:Putative 3-methyladenine DNA glycosylase n=1 Tax=Candidatus Methylacidithermus pantelleriae TaxID=2744239 RepID=A0A8J2FS59_9BACT|nr:DNA-3-methyladenine glycosylase [Candidatus Methylacidithermus pantelleriae]CAF0693955.1 Putative 3-methyladenine DNA glycosylase [Candidatus Methylacidithermus pantelleriae]